MRTKNKEIELNHTHFVAVRLTDIELNLLDQGMDGLNCDPMSFDDKGTTEEENRISVITLLHQMTLNNQVK